LWGLPADRRSVLRAAMMAGRADELGETVGAYDEAKYETHAGEFFDGPMDGALESK
jgi:hypothetical protein